MGSEAGFHEGVVVAVISAVHALAKVSAAKQTAVASAGILAAALGVVNQAGRRLTIANGQSQGGEHELFGHRVIQAPADDVARVAVHE